MILKTSGQNLTLKQESRGLFTEERRWRRKIEEKVQRWAIFRVRQHFAYIVELNSVQRLRVTLLRRYVIYTELSRNRKPS